MIRLLEIMNLKQNYPESGTFLYETIVPLLQNGEPIDIDMTGVVSMPSMFLHTSIGRLKEEYGDVGIKKLAFHNITRAQADRLRDYIARV